MSPSESWDHFLLSTRPETGFMQASWWADVLAEQDWGHFGAVFRSDGDIQGGARVLTRVYKPGHCFYYIPDGPVLPDNDDEAARLFEAMVAFIDKKREQQPEVVSHLRIEPKWTKRPGLINGDWREFSGWLEPRSTLHVDLTLSEADLLAQMKPKGRYNIKLAQKRGVRIVEDTSDEGIDEFLDIYGDTMERKGSECMSFDYLEDLIETLVEEDCGSLFFAEYEGMRLATVLSVFFGERATYFFGGSKPIHRNLMAPYLLHFEIMKKAKRRGHRIYDFYGVAPPDKPDHRWADISTFKRKFGGRDVQFMPVLDYVFDEDAYRDYLAD